MSMALVPLDRERCPDCGGDVIEYRWEEAAFIRHAGYGATLRSDTRGCVDFCGWSLKYSVGEVSPRSLS